MKGMERMKGMVGIKAMKAITRISGVPKIPYIPYVSFIPSVPAIPFIANIPSLLKLAPTNPGIVYLGATARVRRRLPANLRLVDMRPCDCVQYEGIRSQPLVEALKTARDEGEIEADRIADAAAKACDEGLLTEADMHSLILEKS